jgi:hypothetical protein
MKVIFLNGPPGSGKDSIADLLENWYSADRQDFKAHLVFLAVQVSGVGYFNFESRSLKDIPHKDLNGLTPRQFLIKVSEEWVKPFFGPDYFGKRALGDVWESSADICIFPDSGFAEEALPIIRAIGPENCLYIKVLREGTSWAGDSRGSWMTEALNWGVRCAIFENRGPDFPTMARDLRDLLDNDLKDFMA